MKTLEEVLQFKSKAVLHRFHMLHDLPETEAQFIFEDMLRYLWLTATMDERRKSNPDTPDILLWDGMVIMDEMWHCFILHTVRYIEFCESYFGKYIHHPPPAQPKYTLNQATIGEEASREILLSELIETVYDYLGEEVAVRWFDTSQQYNHLNKVH